MKEHLTSKEISQWLVEGPSGGAEGHMRSCFACQAKLAEAQEPLAVFRTAVVAWSENQPARSMASQMEIKERWNWRGWIPVAGLAVAVALLVSVLVVPSAFHKPLVQQAHLPAVSDTVLMEQVDSEVSETVPNAMAPLTDLVAWDSSEDSVEAVGAGKQTAHGKSGSVTKANGKVTD